MLFKILSGTTPNLLDMSLFSVVLLCHFSLLLEERILMGWSRDNLVGVATSLRAESSRV
jgi:hypothetical protein